MTAALTPRTTMIRVKAPVTPRRVCSASLRSSPVTISEPEMPSITPVSPMVSDMAKVIIKRGFSSASSGWENRLISDKTSPTANSKAPAIMMAVQAVRMTPNKAAIPATTSATNTNITNPTRISPSAVNNPTYQDSPAFSAPARALSGRGSVRGFLASVMLSSAAFRTSVRKRSLMPRIWVRA